MAESTSNQQKIFAPVDAVPTIKLRHAAKKSFASCKTV